jgi:hypothetical protein
VGHRIHPKAHYQDPGADQLEEGLTKGADPGSGIAPGTEGEVEIGKTEEIVIEGQEKEIDHVTNVGVGVEIRNMTKKKRKRTRRRKIRNPRNL